MSYIDRLIENCNKAKEAKPIKDFEMKHLSDLDGIASAIYVIEQIDGNIQQTFDDLTNFKKSKERSCPALNAPSQIMYVGSSTTGLSNRIKQHIGDGSKRTFALHLKHWYKGKYTIKIKKYNVSRDVIQIIEDDLSDKLKPAFGKKGGNNK
jgi:hypothetical protein